MVATDVNMVVHGQLDRDVIFLTSEVDGKQQEFGSRPHIQAHEEISLKFVEVL